MSAHDIPAMPDPAEIFAAFTAFHRTGALKAAIELDLFSAIAAGAATADDLARRCGASLRGVRILADVLAAAGHGMFGITLAQANPRAEIVALDWANVLTVAEENARAAGVQDRFRTIKGNAFEVDLGAGYDLVLLPNFLHHFDVAMCEAFLRRVRAALVPGGRAVTVEFIPDESRVTPTVAASFALVMLVGTPAGDAYTFAELERMFRNAGFEGSELRELPPSFQR